MGEEEGVTRAGMSSACSACAVTRVKFPSPGKIFAIRDRVVVDGKIYSAVPAAVGWWPCGAGWPTAKSVAHPSTAGLLNANCQTGGLPQAEGRYKAK